MTIFFCLSVCSSFSLALCSLVLSVFLHVLINLRMFAFERLLSFVFVALVIPLLHVVHAFFSVVLFFFSGSHSDFVPTFFLASRLTSFLSRPFFLSTYLSVCLSVGLSCFYVIIVSLFHFISFFLCFFIRFLSVQMFKYRYSELVILTCLGMIVERWRFILPEEKLAELKVTN